MLGSAEVGFEPLVPVLEALALKPGSVKAVVESLTLKLRSSVLELGSLINETFLLKNNNLKN